MNQDDDMSSDPLDEQAMLFALGALGEDERAQFENCLGCPHSAARARLAEYQHLVGTMTTALVPSSPPRPELKQRIMDAVAAEGKQTHSAQQMPPLSVAFLAHGEGKWHNTPYPGVRLRELSNASADTAVFMLDLDAGAGFPDHDHEGAEDMYLLSGDLDINGKLMGAGDFMHSEPGSHHHAMHSPGGCQAIVMTSRRNYSSNLMHAYSAVDRVKTRVRQWLGAV